jgi:hypothetical protein
MIKSTSSLTLLASLLVLGLNVMPAQAINARSFIASFGSDANPCTRPQPCRTLQFAHNNTIIGGEINMLDVAGYGTVTITKAISIVNDGVGSAGVLVPASSTGITINAGVNDEIYLRGLIIEGTYSTGTTGIKFNSGSGLTLTNCVIHGTVVAAIDFSPTGVTTNANLRVINSLIAGFGQYGIKFAPTGTGFSTLFLNRVDIQLFDTAGLYMDASGMNSASHVVAHIRDSALATNTTQVSVKTVTGQSPLLVRFVHSSIVHGNTGIVADGAGAVVQLTESTLGPSVTAVVTLNSGAVQSFGDNIINGNLGGDPVLPIFPKS